MLPDRRRGAAAVCALDAVPPGTNVGGSAPSPPGRWSDHAVEEHGSGLDLDELVDYVDGPVPARPAQRLVQTEYGVEQDVGGVDGAEHRCNAALTVKTGSCRDPVRPTPQRAEGEMCRVVQQAARTTTSRANGKDRLGPGSARSRSCRHDRSQLFGGGPPVEDSSPRRSCVPRDRRCCDHAVGSSPGEEPMPVRRRQSTGVGGGAVPASRLSRGMWVGASQVRNGPGSGLPDWSKVGPGHGGRPMRRCGPVTS